MADPEIEVPVTVQHEIRHIVDQPMSTDQFVLENTRIQRETRRAALELAIGTAATPLRTDLMPQLLERAEAFEKWMTR